MLLIEVPKIIDFEFKMLTLERSTQTYKYKARADPSAFKKGWGGRVGACREDHRLFWKWGEGATSMLLKYRGN